MSLKVFLSFSLIKVLLITQPPTQPSIPLRVQAEHEDTATVLFMGWG